MKPVLYSVMAGLLLAGTASAGEPCYRCTQVSGGDRTQIQCTRRYCPDLTAIQQVRDAACYERMREAMRWMDDWMRIDDQTNRAYGKGPLYEKDNWVNVMKECVR